MATQAAFTSDAVRGGEPEALAALCVQRGVPVFAYCDQVAAPRQAALAAADAFALLRSDLVAAARTDQLDVDALLQTATRRAAAERGIHAATPPTTLDDCAGLEPALVANLERPIGDPERERFDEHIAGCPACAPAMRRLEAGQRAFDRPPRAPLPRSVAEQMITALVAAGPVIALGGDADAVRAQALQLVYDQIGERPAAAPPVADEATAQAPAEAPQVTAARVAPEAPAHVAPEARGHVAPEAPAQVRPEAPAQVPPDAQITPPGTPPVADATAPGHDASSAPPSASRWQSGSGARRSLKLRRPPRPEFATLGALITDTWSAARYRVAGPRPGATERPRQRLPITRGRVPSKAARSAPAGSSEARSAELAAIALFAAVAITVGLVTFLVASPSESASNAPDRSLLPVSEVAQPMWDRRTATSRSSSSRRGTARSESRASRARPRPLARDPASSQQRSPSAPQASMPRARPPASSGPSVAPPPADAPPAGANEAATEPDDVQAVPGGDFSREGET